MKIQLAVLASFFYLGSLAAQHITTHSGGQVNTTAVANRIATQLPAAPDLANAWFLVEKLPTQTVGGNAIRARVYSVNNLDQVMGINYIGGTTPTIWSASGAHSSGASDYTQELSSGKKINDFSRFVANKTGPSAQGGVFTFSELGGVAIEQTLPGITLHGINNFGWMLAVEPEQPGYSYNFKSYYGRHFILKGTGEVNIVLPRDAENGAYLEGINITGQVVGGASPQYGYVGARGFFAEADGKIRWLTSNNNFDEAYGVNDSGQIVGTTSLPDYSSVPAFWENGRGGAIESLPTVRLAGGFENAWANGINKWGQIVGRTRAGIALWLNKRQLDFAGRLINPENLKLISLLDINDHGVMLGEQNYTQGGVTYNNNFILRPIWPELAVDANRDGEIKFLTNGTIGSEDNSDATSADKPYRFWLNDDDDNSFSSPQWNDNDPEHYPARRADSSNQFIDSPRDCEDLSRICLNLSGLSELLTAPSSKLRVGLKWRNVTGLPGIRLFRSADTAGGLRYIKEAPVAVQQAASVAGGPRYCLSDIAASFVGSNPLEESGPWAGITTVQPQSATSPADFIFRPEDLRNTLIGGALGHLLFEGTTEGKGELVLVILQEAADGSMIRVGEAGSVWLQLDNIRRMYVRAHSEPLAENFPLPWQVSSPPPSPYDEDSVHEKALSIPDNRLWYGAGDSVESLSQFPFVASPGEQNKCVIFVHGIDLDVPTQQGYAQSFYKRLWWEGYRGRFIVFRWCTPLTSDGLFGWDDTDENTSIFNSGEYRSWKGGSALKKFADALRNPESPFYFSPNPTIGMLAHSLGNACAGEALRQGMQINSYVALKAAVPLSCYYPVGAGAPMDRTLVDADALQPTPQYAGNYNGYHGYLSSIGGANKVNYYGARDFWLVTGSTSFGLSVDWVTNMRKYKPDDPLDSFMGTALIKYLWDANQLKSYFRRDAFYRLVTDPHEGMAFVSRPRTLALGAASPPSGFSGVDLESPAAYDFGPARFDHSGPFQRNIQLMYGNQDGVPWVDAASVPLPFYRRLLRDLQMSP